MGDHRQPGQGGGSCCGGLGVGLTGSRGTGLVSPRRIPSLVLPVLPALLELLVLLGHLELLGHLVLLSLLAHLELLGLLAHLELLALLALLELLELLALVYPQRSDRSPQPWPRAAHGEAQEGGGPGRQHSSTGEASPALGGSDPPQDTYRGAPGLEQHQGRAGAPPASAAGGCQRLPRGCRGAQGEPHESRGAAAARGAQGPCPAGPRRCRAGPGRRRGCGGAAAGEPSG